MTLSNMFASSAANRTLVQDVSFR